MGDGKKSKRSLAAIVFTDIVDFSVLMGNNEELAMRLSSRDHDLFKNICSKYEGKVLKSTGDGLLMYFGSAVQAVACSLKIQEAVSVIAKEVPPDQQLCHRIGVHLGDVYVSQDDVMGDGVNIASRIQEEAEPGGVCISQTVYDVVKNRLGLQVMPLGPRELKNIKEAVPVYRIILDAADISASKRPAVPAYYGKKKLVVSGIVLAAVMLVAVILYICISRQNDDRQADDVSSAGEVKDSNRGRTLHEKPGPKLDKDEKKQLPRVTDARMKEAVVYGRTRFLPSGDFEGFVKFLEQKGFGDSVYCRMISQVGEFRKSVFSRLKEVPSNDPLGLQIDPNEEGSRVDIWTENGKLVIRGRGQTREFGFDSVPWKIQIAVMFRLSKTSSQRTLAGFLLRELKEGGLMEKGSKKPFRPRFRGRGEP